MTDPTAEAVRMIRGLKEEVDRLRGQREGEGDVNLLRLVTDRSTTADVINARLNDAEVFDRSNTDDTVSTTVNTGATFIADSSTADGTDVAG